MTVMARIRKVGDLEVPTDLHMQRATWAIQRGAWLAMAAIILAGILGLFGGGAFGRTTVEQAGMRVEYERFCRLASPTTVDVRIEASSEGEARIWVARGYIDRAGIERVEPTPARVESSDDGLTYVVTATTPGKPTRVRFHLRPDRPGPLGGRIRAEGGVVLEFNQFVHP